MQMSTKRLLKASLVLTISSVLLLWTDRRSSSLLYASRFGNGTAIAGKGYGIQGVYGPISVAVTPSIAGRDTNVTIQVSVDRTKITGNVVVTLTNDDASQFSTWPTSVTIPSTSSSASVTARTSHWDTGSLVTITATCTGGTATTTLTTLSSIIY